MIKWNNTLENELPQHGQEVIISVNGVNYISTYDASKRIFRTNELLETFFKVSDKQILWTDNHDHLANPQMKKDRAKIYRGQANPVKTKK